jgi:hypothetical protein
MLGQNAHQPGGARAPQTRHHQWLQGRHVQRCHGLRGAVDYCQLHAAPIGKDGAQADLERRSKSDHTEQRHEPTASSPWNDGVSMTYGWPRKLHCRRLDDLPIDHQLNGIDRRLAADNPAGDLHGGSVCPIPGTRNLNCGIDEGITRGVQDRDAKSAGIIHSFVVSFQCCLSPLSQGGSCEDGSASDRSDAGPRPLGIVLLSWRSL